MSGAREDQQIIDAMTGRPALSDHVPSPSASIELEPLDPTPVPQRNVGQFADARTETVEGAYAVPSRPLHLCPNCEYNLTGLTSRRCPECGEGFTLHEARDRGFESSELMRSFRFRVQLARVKVAIGIVLMVLAFVGANSLRLNGLFGPTFTSPTRLTFPGLLLLLTTGASLVVVTFIKLYFEVSWANLILGIGIFMAALAMLFIF